MTSQGKAVEIELFDFKQDALVTFEKRWYETIHGYKNYRIYIIIDGKGSPFPKVTFNSLARKGLIDQHLE